MMGRSVVPLVLWLLALASLGLCPAAARAGEAPASITVTLDENYPPFIFRDQQGQLAGQLKDAWELWSRKTGIEVRFDAVDWGTAQRHIADGRADVIDTIFKTAARAPLYEFSPPYASIDVAIFHQRDIGGIVDERTLRGFTIGVKDGDACVDWLTDHNIGPIELYASYESLIDAAGRKEVLVFCMDMPPAQYLLAKKNLLDQFHHTKPLYTGQFHWAVRKGATDLRDRIAAGYATLTAEERQELGRRWQGYAMPQAPWFATFDTLGRWILGLAVAGLAMIGWNWALRRQVARKTRSLTEAMDALALSEQRFRTIYDNVSDAIFLHEWPSGRILSVNQRMREMYGQANLPVEEMEFSIISQGAPPYDRAAALAWMRRTVADGPQVFEWMARKADGTLFWVEVSMRMTHIGEDTRILVAGRDITERKAAQSHLEYLALHDPLTQLPNQRLIEDMVKRAIDRAEIESNRVALLFLDLDQFKTINDTLGHVIGDRFLCELAARFSLSLQRMGTVGRQGGDEFIVFLPSATEEAIESVVARLHDAVALPVDVDGHELAVTLSVGIAAFPDDGRDFPALLKAADAAMYHAKAAGRSTHRYFTPSMNSQYATHLAVSGGLRKALDRGEFVLHYQPQVAIADRAVVGVEALIRWNHPERGLLPPAEFIAIAEEAGLIVPIGAWVIRQACRDAARWERQGRPLRVAVNLSALQFRGNGLEQAVRSALMEAGLSAHLLELELTETVLLSITDEVQKTVCRLRRMGVHLSIDDFGTGYSSLAYIKRLAVTRLKIDRSFVTDIDTNPDTAAIAATIIRMAHSLGLTAVAEGVETEAVLTMLREWDCDLGQGYLFGKPVSVETLETEVLAPVA